MRGHLVAGRLLELGSQHIGPGDQGLDEVLAICGLEVSPVWKRKKKFGTREQIEKQIEIEKVNRLKKKKKQETRIRLNSHQTRTS